LGGLLFQLLPASMDEAIMQTRKTITADA